MKLEPIIKAKLSIFKDTKGYSALSDAEAFEYFVNYHVLYSMQPEVFFGNTDLLDVVTVGGSNDMSIDGIAFKINDCIVKTAEDVKSIYESRRKVKIEFVFIQSKLKRKVDMGEFNNFIFGVKDFLADNQK